MLNEDSFHYAVENTKVLRPPQKRIATFGNTSFRFYLITEMMDRANQVRVRDGQLVAERPQIITPGYYDREALEGFGDKAQEFLDWLEENSQELAIVKYGFQFRKVNVTEEIVNSTVADVAGRLNEEVEQSGDPLSAIIQGVDEGWEVCLLKFTADLIQESAGGNIGDLKKRGLL